MNNTYIVIMAGGEGTRFVPLSTPEKPKQFLNFLGEGTFVQQTRNRIRELVPPERILVATNERYVSLVREQLPDIPADNIIGEPLKKNTAPCIAYASRLILGRDGKAAVVVLPSDHVIRKPDRFKEVIRLAVRAARAGGRLVTIGIRPEWPSCDYGYIKSSGKQLKGIPSVYEVDAFVEKPDERTANGYIEAGSYYWNSGMFIWAARTVLAEISVHLPEMAGLLDGFTPDPAFKQDFFERVEGISIDYAVMERSKAAAVIPCDLGWSDVGTWEGLFRLSKLDGIKIAPEVVLVMNEQLRTRA